MNERSYWLALHRAPGIGSAIFCQLLEQYGSPAEVFAASARITHLSDETQRYLRQPDWKGIEQDLAWLKQPNCHLLTLADKCYPVLLKEIPDPPPVLFIHGDLSLLSSPQLAIVGSRNPSPAGSEMAAQFAHYLGGAGLVIDSGLALGIDAAAHQGALAAKTPTIAVVGTGLDRVYPARHRALAYAISEGGALVSEFPIGTPPLPQNFPRRNRIISGLSLGVLVIEAALQSGSLITARLGADQGREIFAIPGSIHNPLARGCHRLIREGAKLVESAQDILEELGSLINVVARPQPREVFKETSSLSQDPEYQLLLDNLGYDPVSVDVLVERCGLTAERLSSMLLILELQGLITTLPGGRYFRCSKEGQL
ncbi:DNA protecting protein DprA [Candidatus Nitrosoglobus terrae]|uniref:DNA protecting protein DprA n=1 Tax=Candidatus Nitrosoglobus terrae TaxID=1630141 RepID=A0A1Q2SPE9_9GAMM|nr:DNA-processing protein DprA [Candidatus Nitrosoglobus terrae]BAW81014.1 DNA protecting protein DprA [Candidatus Nitrosoglobus terrae]